MDRENDYRLKEMDFINTPICNPQTCPMYEECSLIGCGNEAPNGGCYAGMLDEEPVD